MNNSCHCRSRSLTRQRNCSEHVLLAQGFNTHAKSGSAPVCRSMSSCAHLRCSLIHLLLKFGSGEISVAAAKFTGNLTLQAVLSRNLAEQQLLQDKRNFVHICRWIINYTMGTFAVLTACCRCCVASLMFRVCSSINRASCNRVLAAAAGI